MAMPERLTRRVCLYLALAVGLCGLTACLELWPAPGQGASGSTATAGSLAFVASLAGSTEANVYLVTPRGGQPHAVTRGSPSVSDAAWTASGRELVFARRDEHLTSTGHGVGHVDVFVLRRGGTPHLIRRCPLTCWARSFAWSPDGSRIAFVTNIRSRFTGYAGEIAVMNADGSGFHVVCTEAECGQGLDDPQWSRDGSQLLFSNMAVIDFLGIGLLPSRVWVAQADGSDAHPLTQRGCRPGHPPLRGCAYDSAASWSPNGNWIAFSRHNSIPFVHRQPQRTRIELMHPDGSDLHALASCTGDLCNQVMPPVWSPDGSRIAYAPAAERGPSIVIVSPAGGRSTVGTCQGGQCVTPFDLVWAPGGRSLGLLSQARSPAAYVIDATGGRMHAVGHDVQCCLAWLSGG
jgi:Tol biopolymer transport system component